MYFIFEDIRYKEIKFNFKSPNNQRQLNGGYCNQRLRASRTIEE